MKILFFIPSLGAGGAERTVINLAKYLADRGHIVGVLSMLPVGRDFYVVSDKVARLSLNRPTHNRGLRKITGNLALFLELRKTLRAWQPDVVVGMMVHSALIAILAAAGLPCKIVVAERNNPVRQDICRHWRRGRKLLYNRAAAVVAQTEHTKHWLEGHVCGLKKSGKTVVIPNAVNWPMHDYPPRLNPDDVVPPDRKIMLAAGRLHPQKGHDLLIAAFAQVAQKYPDWLLVILGEGAAADCRQALERQAADAGLAGRVLLPGRAGNIAEWFARADIFALSSRYEGFPNVLLEAMAAGCACVSFDCDTGPREIIRHETDGLLVPPEKIDAMAAGLARLMRDEVWRGKMAACAMEVRDRFAPGKILGQWEALFGRLCVENNQ